MEEIPDLWRTEVFHPLSVHFPIALLLVAFLFKLVSLKYRREVWERGGTVLLILGVLTIWIAVYTGDLADGIVSRKICDPTVLKDHENMAMTSAWLFTAGLAVDLIRQLKYPVFRNLVSCSGEPPVVGRRSDSCCYGTSRCHFSIPTRCRRLYPFRELC